MKRGSIEALAWPPRGECVQFDPQDFSPHHTVEFFDAKPRNERFIQIGRGAFELNEMFEALEVFVVSIVKNPSRVLAAINNSLQHTADTGRAIEEGREFRGWDRRGVGKGVPEMEGTTVQDIV